MRQTGLHAESFALQNIASFHQKTSVQDLPLVLPSRDPVSCLQIALRCGWQCQFLSVLDHGIACSKVSFVCHGAHQCG